MGAFPSPDKVSYRTGNFPKEGRGVGKEGAVGGRSGEMWRVSPDGGTGRRAGLNFLWSSSPCGFESHSGQSSPPPGGPPEGQGPLEEFPLRRFSAAFCGDRLVA